MGRRSIRYSISSYHEFQKHWTLFGLNIVNNFTSLNECKKDFDFCNKRHKIVNSSVSSLISCKYPGIKIQIAYPINLKRLTHTFHITESDNVIQKREKLHTYYATVNHYQVIMKISVIFQSHICVGLT